MGERGAIGEIEIRPEQPADFGAIGAVVDAAFPGPSEARLVTLLRASEFFVPGWSLVAEIGGRIVGHVMVSFASLDDDTTTPLVTHRVPSLAPLAVAPEYQRRGIGGALVEAVVALVDEAGYPLVILEGAPAYYGRLGFEYSVPHGITFPLPDWAPAEAAQVRRLRAYDPSIRGHVVYPPAFEECLKD